MLKSKFNYFAVLLLVALFAGICIARNNEKGINLGIVEIQSVSTRKEVENFDPQGSIVGGTMVYLKVKNHSMTPSENKVFIGPYPCIIAEKGISGNLISCMTTPQTEPDRFWELPVELHVHQKVQSKCTSTKGKCVFTYNRSATPYLKYIGPNAGTPDQKVVINALWRVANTQDIKKIKIGDDNCNRFELEEPSERSTPSNLNDDLTILKSYYQNIECQLSKDQVAGVYQTSFETTYGDLYKYSSATYVTADGSKEYQFAIIGEVSEISSNTGGENGNELVISGKGFGDKKENVQVKIGALNCNIKTISNNEITCDLEAGPTQAPAVDQFESGQGARYTKYRLGEFTHDDGTKFWKSPANNPAKLREAIQTGTLESKRIIEDYTIGSWESVYGDDVQDESRLGVHVRGFFKAPRTGKYAFWIASDDESQVFLNTSPRNTTIDPVEDLILDKCDYNHARDYFMPKQCGAFRHETATDLQEGEFYWIELFTVDFSGSGHFTLSVETPAPSDGSLWSNALDEVQQLKIVPNKDNEQWSLKMFNSADPFEFSFKYSDPQTRQVTFNPKTGEKLWQDWDPQELVNEIHKDLDKKYDAILIESHDLDASGERCTGCTPEGKEVILEFNNIRPSEGKYSKPIECNQGGSTCKIQRLGEASTGLSGTFQMQIVWNSKEQERTELVEVWLRETNDRPSGWSSDIPLDTSIHSIKSGLVRLDSEFEQVQVYQQGSHIDGRLYQFDWKRDTNKERTPTITFNLANVEGGKGRPQIQNVPIVQRSNRPFHEPIPFDMSYVNDDSPNVHVIVNDIVSQCKSDCSYNTDSAITPVINSFSESGKTVTINLSAPVGTTVDDLEITYSGYNCEITNTDLAALTCDIAGIEAGDHTPIVLVKNVGYASNSNPVQTESIVISSISPTTGSVNGGQKITISGTGFPQSDLKKATVKFGTVVALVKSTQYDQMEVILPGSLGQATGQQALTIAYNGQTSNNDVEITYSDTNVSAINTVEVNSVTYNHDQHVKVSPVRKQQITIVGTGFGSVKSDISVWLLKFNSDDNVWEQKYEVNVNTLNPAGTEMVATLSGGRVGEYQLRVYHNTYGYSMQAVQFSYKIEIQSISTNQGPKQGGEKMIITGLNFSPVAGNNQVLFEQDGGNVATLAQIESQSPDGTTLVIRIPKMNASGDINSPWLITYFGRIIEQADCEDSTHNCQFTYLDGVDTPTITVSGIKDVKNREIVRIEGLNLPTSADSAQAIISGYDTPIALTLDSDTRLGDLTIPDDIETGTYQVQIILESYGGVGLFYIKVAYEIIEVLPQQKISVIGEDITINGSGFTSDTKIAINGKECVIRSYSTVQIVCTTPIADSEGKLDVVAYNEVQSTICEDCVEHSNALTPIVVESIPLSKDSVEEVPSSNYVYRVENQTGFSGTITAYLQYTFAPSFRISGTAVQDGDSYDITFNNIVAGEYQVLIHVDGKGYAKIPLCSGGGCDGPAPTVTFTLDDSTYSAGDQTGLAGGTELTIAGQGFNHEIEQLNKVSVCGHQCKIVPGSVSLTELKCKLPKVNTKYVFDEDYDDEEEQVEQLARSRRRHLISHRVADVSKFFKEVLTSETSNQNVINQIVRGPVEKRANNPNEFWIEFHTHDNTKIFIDTLVLNPGRDFNLDHYFENVKLQAKNLDSDPWTDLDVFEAGHLSEYSEVNFRIRETGDDADDDDVRKTFVSANSYKIFRVLETQEVGESAFASLFIKRVIGDVFYEQNIAADQDFTCNTIIRVNNQVGGIDSSAKITYKGSIKTPRVTDISPSFSTHQGSDIVIKGEKFGTNPANVKVFIKGQECTVNNVVDNQIDVTVPAYSPVDEAQNILVTLDGVPVLFKKGIVFFPGALLWSHEDTWGGETAPSQGNMVVVPKGQTLVVDQSTPKPLQTVIVEGTLLFDPDLGLDIEFDVIYMLIRKGQLIAGTELKPYKNKLTFTLHGNFHTKQLPEYGNKVIGCHNCQLDLHAEKKGPHYGFLDQTVDKGAEQLIVDREVDWQVGDYIGLATTDYDGAHSEKLLITNITVGGGKSTIDFSPKLQHRHVSEEETFGSKTLKVRAEVIYLSSNLVIRGNPEDSITEKYGGHLMIHGRTEEGTLARIDGVEFRHTGQPRIIGRYTCHFHMLGDSPNTYVRNIKVHDAFARVVAVHATSHIKVQNNVGFKVPGHNIFLEDGVETNNLVEGNVLVSPRSAFTMLQTDITVAGIWVTNPSNYVRYNIIAGSEFYGMWYEIKEKPDSRIDLCPHGMPVLQLEHNIGHSCQRFGLRFFHLKPRKFPCQLIRDDSLEDPFSKNPSIQYTYHNQTSYKNGESGILAEFMGNSIFKDCIMADNFRAGFQAHTTNFTQAPVILKDSVIIGKSTINGEVVPYQSSAVLTPRTGGFLVDNVEIHNMPNNTNLVESSSENQDKLLWVQGGYQQNFQNIQIFNSSAAGTIRWRGPRANLVYDHDGSVTGTGQPTWIAPYQPHFDRLIETGECQHKTTGYDNSVVCTTRVRAIKFSNFQIREDFRGQMMRIFDVRDTNKTYQQDADYDNKGTYGDMLNIIIKNKKKDLDGAYVALLPVNSIYNIHWNKGIDWDHILLWPSYVTESDDDTIILRFPYSEQRELFEVFRMVAKKNVKKYAKQDDIKKFFNPSTLEPNNTASGCVNGDWIQDPDNQYFYLCLNGKGRDNIKYQQVDLNGIYCRDTCDTGGFSCDKESKVRNFMEPTSLHNATYLDKDLGAMAMAKAPGTEEWQYRVPQEGDDVKIPCEWTMRFNLDSFRFNNLYIDGTLRIEQSSTAKKTIIATNIWVRGGKLAAGLPDDRFTQNLEIILTGEKDSESIVIDDISRTGTKSLAVTGQLELYGVIPSTTRTRLAQIANIGDTTIVVKDDISEWQVGDELGLGASSKDGSGFEKVKITAKDDATKTLTLENPIQFWHYGHSAATVSSDSDSEVVIDQKYGEGKLDMRTPVGHLTRNIKIMGNKEATNWGGHLQVYQYIFSDKKTGLDVNARGNAILEGVEFDNMGQRGSGNAGLHIMLTNREGTDEYRPTILKGSSIHDCIGMCVNAEDAFLFTLEENVIYHGRKFLIQALNTQSVTIKNNFLIALEKRKATDVKETKIWDPTAFIHMYTPYLPSRDNHLVYGNVGSGAEGIGYAFPATPCEEQHLAGYKNNEAAFCSITGAIFNLKENRCYHLGYVQVHNCVDGVTLNSKRADNGYNGENILVAECEINLKLHTGSTALIHNNFISKSWFSAVARPNCAECYTSERIAAKNSQCKKLSGIQLHVTTIIGESFPCEQNPLKYDVICTAPSAFGSSFITDVELHMFKNEYSVADHPNLVECSENRAFRNHRAAASATAATYLRNVKCINCDKDGYIHIMEPKERWRGWFGGCGQFDCTGLENMLIQDITGDFLGHEGSIVSNNEPITMSEGMSDICTYYAHWNAYDCVTTDFGVLEWDAVSEDKQKLSPAPVFITNDVFTNKINMWREWSWQGPEPLNERLNRYVSLVLANQWHNITYSGSKCTNIVHKLSQRSKFGESERFIIVKYQYSTPLALEIAVNGKIIPPYPLNNPGDLQANNRTDCGANNYYFENNTIHWTMTNEADCHVNVYQKNFLQVNLRLSMTKEEFYEDDENVSNFINVMAAFLKVDFSQVRIIGVKSYGRRRLEEGSSTSSSVSELSFIVLDTIPTTEEAGYKPKENYLRLKTVAQEIEQGFNDKAINLGYQVSFESADPKVIKEVGQDIPDDGGFMSEKDLIDQPNSPGTPKPRNSTDPKEPDNALISKEKEEKDSMIVIALGIIFGVMGAVIIAMIVYHFWKKRQFQGIKNVSQSDDFNANEKQMVTNVVFMQDKSRSRQNSHNDLNPQSINEGVKSQEELKSNGEIDSRSL